MNFLADKYCHIKNALSREVCDIATSYALLKQKLEFNPEQTAGRINTHSIYGDTLIECILSHLHPKIEEITKLKLYPTYSYYRVYSPGDSLPAHFDRVECEISTTLCIGSLYKDVDSNYSWNMYAQIGENEPVCPVCLPGDMVVYRGRDVKHWREPFTAGPGSYQVQAFLHYVDANGPYASRKFDRRPGLGFPLSTKDPSIT